MKWTTKNRQQLVELIGAALLRARLNTMTSSNGSLFRVTGPLCGEFTGQWWIPLTKVSDTELWFFSFICAWKKTWVNKAHDTTLTKFNNIPFRPPGDDTSGHRVSMHQRKRLDIATSSATSWNWISLEKCVVSWITSHWSCSGGGGGGGNWLRPVTRSFDVYLICAW